MQYCNEIIVETHIERNSFFLNLNIYLCTRRTYAYEHELLLW